MRSYSYIVLILILSSGCTAHQVLDVTENKQNSNTESIIAKKSWMHGSPNCSNSRKPIHDIYKHDENTYIFRQNKCITFEAPFIYILVGSEKVLVLDTGAIAQNAEYSLYKEVENLLGREQLSTKELIVMHSHGHSDHTQGDSSFAVHPNIKLIEASETYQYLGLTDKLEGEVALELGERQLTVLSTPGHQEEAITIYDQKTQWLLTGDTLYPGYIYIKDWKAYKGSIDKLSVFSSKNNVKAIMGAHIEMKRQSASYYPIGTTYQPDEPKLDLTVKSLHRLNAELKKSDKPVELVFDDFIIKPMNGFQKTLSNVVRWFSQ